jgi:hypothetical protein
MPLANKRQLFYFGVIFAVFFTFYYTFILQILPISSADIDINLMQAIFTLSIVFSILLTNSIKKYLGKKCLYSFFVVIPFLTLFMLIGVPVIVRFFITIINGAFFGLSQLIFIGFFWKSISSNRRGQSAAFIVFIALPIYFLTSTVLTSEMGLANLTIVLSTLFVVAFAATLKLTNESKINKNENFHEKRTIILYTIPWIIFSFINATFSRTISLNKELSISPDFFLVLSVLQIIGALVGALIGGKIADQIGRRTTLAISITLYGISMAISGFALSSGITLNSFSLFFSFLIDGLSWGIILTIYIFVIWGDLANSKNYLAIYSIGLSVFFLTAGLGYFSASLFSSISVSGSTLIGCSLIFLCNVPIAFAPELLISETREKSQIDSYLKKVRKVAKDLDN